MKIRKFNFNKEDSTINLDSTILQFNDFNKSYILPMEIYTKLDAVIDIDTADLTTVIAYLEILTRIHNGYKCSKRILQSISTHYITIIDTLKDNNIIEWVEKFNNVYNPMEEYPWMESTPNRYELILSDYDSFTFLFIDTDEEAEELNVYIQDEINNNEVINHTLMNVRMNWQNAITEEYNYLSSKNLSKEEFSRKYTSRVNNIFKFLTHRMMVKGKKVERIYSSFTMLSGVARKHLHINGKFFNSIDLSNAQPTLLVAYLKKNNLPMDDNYIIDVIAGIFYEKLMGRASEKGYLIENKIRGESRTFHLDDRDHVKVLCYRGIFFKQNTKLKIWEVFAELYPLVADSLLDLKKDKSKSSLASELQTLEANIFHNVKLSTPYYIVHDAIYFTEITENDSIKAQILSFFDENSIKKPNLDTVFWNEVDRYSYNGTVGITESLEVDVIGVKNRYRPHKKHNQSLIHDIEDLLKEGKSNKEIGWILERPYKTIVNNISKNNLRS